MTTKRSAGAATIFSRVWAPPPPLTSQRSGAIWSAPSIAMSRRSSHRRARSGCPSSRACCSVAAEVATQRRSAQAPVGERGQQVGDGGAGPEADRHPVLDQLRGGLGRQLLLGVKVGVAHRRHTSRRIVAMAVAAERRADIDAALHQHDPHALDRRDPEGELRPPGYADGAGTRRLRALAALPPLRSAGPDLAEPRPLRALQRPRLDAPLLAASPDRGEGGRPRLRGGGRARGEPRGHQALPPARLEVSRPPRVPLDLRGGDTTGPLGQGIATSVGMAIASKWLAARYNRAGLPAVRLRRLRVRRRRLLHGGGLERGRLLRRPPAARQPLLGLRQQPHHDRRPHGDHLRGRRRRSLRGLRLERHPGWGRERPRVCSPAPSRRSARRRSARP